MRDDLQRLRDIAQAIAKIEEYQVEGRARYDTDQLIQVWMLMHLLIIGEAASKLSKDLRDANPQIQWKGIIALRNIVVHVYFAVNLNRVWNTIENDLPLLKTWVNEQLDASS